ncbi:MAG: VWA domain-containing protein [Deltaproteobacteria bacterium]|nr:VWA domain-containing protein [Deltaproteobacteria bacterium]
MTSLDFIRREWLLALMTLPLLYWLLSRFAALREERLRRLGRSGSSSKLLLYGPLLCFACGLLALSRPYLGYEDVKVPRSGRDIMLVVDVSLSMAAKDSNPSRMEFAKRKVRDIIDYVSKTSGGDRLGIILFAGESYLYCPLTADYSVLRTFTSSISVGLVSSGGSAITQALVTAANSFTSTKATHPAVILISDGEDNELVVQRSLDILKGYKLKLWALGIGSLEGKPIELRDGILLKDSKSQIVISKLNEAGLQQLADGSGGIYRRATVDDSDIAAIFADISKKISVATGSTEQDQVRVYNEFGPLLLWIPLALLCLVALAARRELLFALLLSVALTARSAIAQEPTTTETATPEAISAYEAQAAYERGDFNLAKKGFAQLYRANPDDLKALQALASSEFRLEQFKEASAHFSELLSRSESGRDRFNALYNKGTADIRAQQYDQAVDALEKALTIKPKDEAAEHNLELARTLKQQKEQEQQKKQKQEQNKDNQKKEDSEQDKKSEQQQQQQQENQQNQENKGQQQDQQPGQEQKNDPSDKGDAQSNEEEKPEGQQQTGDPRDSNESPEGREQDASSTPTPGPSEQSGEEPTPSPEKGANTAQSQPEQPGDSDSREEQPGGAQQPAQYDPKALKQREAQTWLESLDDSPVLLRRQVGNKRSNQQQSW